MTDQNNIKIILRSNNKLIFEIHDLIYDYKFQNPFESQEIKEDRDRKLLEISNKLRDNEYNLTEEESEYIKYIEKYLDFAYEAYHAPVIRTTVNGEEAFLE